MSFWEILIVCFGLSLDVFAVAACEGAMLARVRLDRLLVKCAVFSLWQVVALEMGRLVSILPHLDRVSAAGLAMWNTLSAVIFFALSALLILKAIRQKPIFEHCAEPTFRQIMAAGALLSIDAFFAGFGTGLLNAPWLLTGLTLFGVTALCVAAGILIGYRFGYEQRTAAYWVGGALFCAAGIDVIVQHLA